jgi:hypothetical protein
MMKIDGACHCEKITYEAEVNLDEVEICHCTDCQTLSGSAFRIVVPVTEQAFRLLTGTPKIYTKLAESGAERWQVFCPDCGTQIYATAAKTEPKLYGIRVGTIRQRHQLAPKRQYWCRPAMSWVQNIVRCRGLRRNSALTV